MKIKIIALATVAVSLAACATVYTDENFTDFQKTHKTVAVVPFSVTIDQKNLPKDVNIDSLKASEIEEGEIFQRQLYSQFLNQYQKGKYTIKFQDVDETNVLLRRNNMSGENFSKFTKSEIGQMLKVDSVISGTIKRAKPLSTGAAVASALLLGYGNTNEVNVNMTLHDSGTGSLLWSYDHHATGGIGSSPERLSKSLMKQTSTKFPYKAK